MHMELGELHANRVYCVHACVHDRELSIELADQSWLVGWSGDHQQVSVLETKCGQMATLWTLLEQHALTSVHYVQHAQACGQHVAQRASSQSRRNTRPGESIEQVACESDTYQSFHLAITGANICSAS